MNILRWIRGVLYEMMWSVVLIFARLGLLGRKRLEWYQQRQRYKNDHKHVLQKSSFNGRILYYCSSLGEYERIKPIISRQSKQTDYDQEICFFSDSGYDYAAANGINGIIYTYAPLDRKKDVSSFFIKRTIKLVVISSNAIWPNFLQYLIDQEIPYLYAGSSFYPSSFLKKKGHQLNRRYLSQAVYLSVVDQDTAAYLQSIGNFSNIVVTGDPRIDSIIYAQNKSAIDLSNWKQDKPMLICGSTHPEDETIIYQFLKESKNFNWKIIIAPHDCNPKRVNEIQEQMTSAQLYSELNKSHKKNICILDKHGVLKHLYRQADYAYIGGGHGTGIHNIMEPIIAGCPVGIGPNYKKFSEARFLARAGAIAIIRNSKDLKAVLEKPKKEKNIKVTEEYFSSQRGAAEKIEALMDHLLQ